MPEPSAPMRLGEAAAPPTAFLEFCQRLPSECGGAPAEVVRTVATTELAQRNAAEARFVQGRKRNNPVATAAVGVQSVSWSHAFEEARRRREALAAPLPAARYDWSAHFAAARAEKSDAVALKADRSASGLEGGETLAWSGKVAPATFQNAVLPLTSPSEVAPAPAMTPSLWSTLNRVNDKVNRAIARKTDIAHYGRIDFWTTPLAEGVAAGDCEDYVLEKKRALIESGLPASALSIAVVTTSWGEAHAVLLVATDQGEYVLDNTTPWIVPWRKANLRWHERQVAGSAFRWANVEDGLPLTLASRSLPGGGR